MSRARSSASAAWPCATACSCTARRTGRPPCARATGAIEVASGRKPRLGAALERVPGARGVSQARRGVRGRSRSSSARLPAGAAARSRTPRRWSAMAAWPPRSRRPLRARRRARARARGGGGRARPGAGAARPARRRARRLPRGRAQGDRRLRAGRADAADAAQGARPLRLEPRRAAAGHQRRRRGRCCAARVVRPGPARRRRGRAVVGMAAAVEVFAWSERHADTRAGARAAPARLRDAARGGHARADERQLEVGRAALARSCASRARAKLSRVHVSPAGADRGSDRDAGKLGRSRDLPPATPATRPYHAGVSRAPSAWPRHLPPARRAHPRRATTRTPTSTSRKALLEEEAPPATCSCRSSRSTTSVLGGIDEAIAILKQCAGELRRRRRRGSDGWPALEVRALHEGDEIAPCETVMTIEGDYALFAHLETVYLGCLARRTLIMRNVREVVEAAARQADPLLPRPPRPLARADRRRLGRARRRARSASPPTRRRRGGAAAASAPSRTG